MKRPHDHEYSTEAHELGYINMQYEKALEAYCDYLEKERDNLKSLINNSNTMYLSMRDERDNALLKGTPCGECNATGAIYVGNSDIDLDGERLCKKCGGTGML